MLSLRQSTFKRKFGLSQETLNTLVKRGIVELQQSGYSAHSLAHPKVVVVQMPEKLQYFSENLSSLPPHIIQEAEVPRQKLEPISLILSMPKKGFRRMADDYTALLRLVGKESIPEIAKDLGITEGAVRGRLARGRELLKDANQFTMTIKNLQKNERVRKFSISAELREQERR